MLRPFSFLNRYKILSSKESSLQKEDYHLPELILAAGQLAKLLQIGRHGHKRSGTGEDFWQFRAYQPHEPASFIDWKQSARSPHEETLWVRERERQTPRPFILWVDSSPSMKWSSQKKLPTKYEVAIKSSLALGQAALRAGENVNALGQKHFLNGSHFLPKLAHHLTHNTSELPLIELAAPHATLLIVSDFLWEESALETLLKSCKNRPGKTIFYVILDPAEYDFSYSGHLKFTSSEDPDALILSANESLQQDYQAELTRQLDILAKYSHVMPHVFYQLHLTNKALLPNLLTLEALLGGKA
ncbi:DUF58 domain-containing protein [Aristophania vespae]|uniref:DUF58 domain-containing protein n=1 Tax=Aristophania vespae TaxID=2697033 RepID=A0A6P1NLY2_9PROT|nr:DUF58 domain-containing protein [Aristophania vespae]QHI95871.1 DUF58 domain-containing protein [Aristophania vespae]UMM63598.1 hypothetical protein DM15PD_05720 [Aristophania vespae]